MVSKQVVAVVAVVAVVLVGVVTVVTVVMVTVVAVVVAGQKSQALRSATRAGMLPLQLSSPRSLWSTSLNREVPNATFIAVAI